MNFRRALAACFLLCGITSAQLPAPKILRVSPNSGPKAPASKSPAATWRAQPWFCSENLQAFKPVSDEKLIALVPRWASKATISVMTSTGRATSPVAFLVRDDPRNP